jgi:hypothetical protein
VVARVAIRDQHREEHPRGSVVEIPGRGYAFYRDVTGANLIVNHNGYAIEKGLLIWLAKRGVGRIHYREGESNLLTSSLDDWEQKSVDYDHNLRPQRVLPIPAWTQYAASLAYQLTGADLDWSVVDARTGEHLSGPDGLPVTVAPEIETVSYQGTKGVRNPGTKPPTVEEMEQQAVEDGALEPVKVPGTQLQESRRTAESELTAAAKAIVELRVALAGDDLDATPLGRAAATVLSYLMRVDKERRS